MKICLAFSLLYCPVSLCDTGMDFFFEVFSFCTVHTYFSSKMVEKRLQLAYTIWIISVVMGCENGTCYFTLFYT